MNIRGIELMRKLTLPAPKKEIICKDISEVDLEYLYNKSPKGATIVVFDYSEEIDQNPLYEKNVRKYEIKREEYSKVLKSLIDELLKKGVKKKNIVFLTHQTYLSDTISFSGRVATIQETVAIDAVRSLRKANSDFNPELMYQYSIVDEKPVLRNSEYAKKSFELPKKIIDLLKRDVIRVRKETSADPYIDFEVYADNGDLFYHDMFLLKK